MSHLKIIYKNAKQLSSRIEAGILLAEELRQFQGQNVAVLGIPRGGVIVAREIANSLHGEMDIVLAHKLGAPGNPELAIGAVCEDGKVFVDNKTAFYTGADKDHIEQEKVRQLQQIAHRVSQYRKVLPKIALAERIVIVTDDGVATGATFKAALWAVRQENPQMLVAAIPVGPDDTLRNLGRQTDKMICLMAPPYFSAVSQFYSSFAQVEDEQLLEILKEENKRRRSKLKTQV